MPGWSQLQTRSGTDCRMSLDDFDDRERQAPGEVMRAALRIAVHLLPPEYHGPVSASVYGAVPLPDRLADLTARAMVDALASSCPVAFTGRPLRRPKACPVCGHPRADTGHTRVARTRPAGRVGGQDQRPVISGMGTVQTRCLRRSLFGRS